MTGRKRKIRFGDSGPRTRVKEEGRERRYSAEFFAKKETSIDKEQERQKERGRL